MKKVVILFFIHSLLASYSFTQETNNCTINSFEVYLVNGDDSTNIRDDYEDGQIIFTLDNSTDYFILNVIEFKDNWFKINTIVSIEYGYQITELEGWVHYSNVKISTRKDLKLLNKPNGEKVIGSIKQEVQVKIIDVCNNWVEIEYEDMNGWVELRWLCGNPVTTCP